MSTGIEWTDATTVSGLTLHAPQDGTYPDYADTLRGCRALVALAGDVSDVHALLIPWVPATKRRPRFGRGGRVYTSAESRAAETRTAVYLRRFFPEPFSGNVALACIFYRAGRQRIDVDNMLKHICDAATGILWHDDSQVTAITGIIELDAMRPRTVLAVAPHVTTMTRGTDSTYPCAQCGAPIPRAGQTNFRKTCSRECAASARGFVLLDEPIPCDQCGKPFKRTTYEQKLCSRECRADLLRNARRARAAPPCLCVDCGKTLTHKRGGRCRDCWRLHLKRAGGKA